MYMLTVSMLCFNPFQVESCGSEFYVILVLKQLHFKLHSFRLNVEELEEVPPQYTMVYSIYHNTQGIF